MRILFFDTSCDFILVGLYTLSENSIREDYFYSGNHPREASYRLITDIETGLKAINQDKPDAIICCSGPGSFTGIRISVTTARNLSQIWKIPTLGFDTLEMYSTYYSEYYKSPVITAIDGKQKKVFAGYSNNEIYKGTYDCLPSEIPTLFKEELEQKNTLIISDTDLVTHTHHLLLNLPNPLSLLKRKISIIHSLNMNDNSYSTLFPNYMRGTYAHK
jgi:tRNA threonylcarbamoyl adenosine modification protein YeaZ